MVELGAIVVIHGVVVGIDRRCIIGWLLVGRVGGGGWCIGRSRSVTVLRCIRCWGSGSQRGQSKGDNDLKKLMYSSSFNSVASKFNKKLRIVSG
jgi:hypothetical protein